MNIVLDIWGGHHSMDHIARYMLPVDEALQMAKLELSAGYLVNLRKEVAWGPEHNFDNRKNDGAN